MGGENGSDVAEIRRADHEDTAGALGCYCTGRRLDHIGGDLPGDVHERAVREGDRSAVLMPAYLRLWCHCLADFLAFGIGCVQSTGE